MTVPHDSYEEICHKSYHCFLSLLNQSAALPLPGLASAETQIQLLPQVLSTKSLPVTTTKQNEEEDFLLLRLLLETTIFS